MFLAQFGLVQLLVGVGLMVEGIVGQIFLAQDKIQFVIEQGLVEVHSQVRIDVQVDEDCFGLLIVGQKVWFQGAWLEISVTSIGLKYDSSKSELELEIYEKEGMVLSESSRMFMG